jgi:5-hydroxyisourate hydrolase
VSLTTHVLDTARGRPAAGVRIDLSAVDAGGRTRLIKTVTTNADGRTDAPLLGTGEMAAGQYELLFHVGAYFRATEAPVTDPPFLDVVPVRFATAAGGGHYHVPLLVSPFGYVTYRGS